MKNLSVGVVIPTFRAAKHLCHCLPPLLQSPLKPRILVIDSSSDDGTEPMARSYGVETHIIPQHQFNHGTTRELGRRYLNTDIVVMMTQDAYATSPHMLEALVKPIIQHEASVAYARQIPHIGAGFFEAFPRAFNYPAQSHIRSLPEADQYGAYTFFCSNSCAAYRNRALDEIGGFPEVLFGEDTLVVVKLLHRAHKIAYVADAEVRHSHHYSLKQEFRRHFDIGLVRQIYSDLIFSAGKDSKRGKAYVKTMLQELIKKHPTQIPYAIMQTAIKWLGYRLGQASIRAPIWWKKALSSHKHYWKALK